MQTAVCHLPPPGQKAPASTNFPQTGPLLSLTPRLYSPNSERQGSVITGFRLFPPLEVSLMGPVTRWISPRVRGWPSVGSYYTLAESTPGCKQISSGEKLETPAHPDEPMPFIIPLGVALQHLPLRKWAAENPWTQESKRCGERKGDLSIRIKKKRGYSTLGHSGVFLFLCFAVEETTVCPRGLCIFLSSSS